MVDEARGIAVHPGVDHRFSIDDEEKRVIVVVGLAFIASIRLGVAHTLADIFNDASALLDRARREHARSVHLRSPHFYGRLLACRCARHA